jgi:hypothetical protein
VSNSNFTRWSTCGAVLSNHFGFTQDPFLNNEENLIDEIGDSGDKLGIYLGVIYHHEEAKQAAMKLNTYAINNNDLIDPPKSFYSTKKSIIIFYNNSFSQFNYLKNNSDVYLASAPEKYHRS